MIGPFLLPCRLGADPRLLFWPYVWRSLGDILLALLTPFPIALILLFTYGLGTSTGAVTYSTVLQRRVPDHIRGRVFATLDVVWATGEIAGIGLAGLLVDHAGIVAVYLAGALLMLAGALGLLLPGVRSDGEPKCRMHSHTAIQRYTGLRGGQSCALWSTRNMRRLVSLVR